MMRIFLFLSLIVTVLSAVPANAGLLISEIACATSGDDWVEITYLSENRSSIDISRLFITMYYGTNENLSSDPITLYSFDRPETSYDDRFAVIHLRRPGIPDETDITGDSDRNGRIDIYCNNYSGSLWNAECAVAIDTDDDPDNGMIDFAAWSDNDGSPSDTILSYVESAIAHGEWDTAGTLDQACMTRIPSGGLKSHESIIRISGDTNKGIDFSTTACQTPGKENIQNTISRSSSIFHPSKTRILVIPGDLSHPGECVLRINEVCTIRMRVFTDIGQMVYDSGLIKDVTPGVVSVPWKNCSNARTGLYIALIDGNVSSRKKTKAQKIFFIITRYR
jgi:hypothetical protein